VLLGTLALALSLLGSVPTGEIKVALLDVSVVSLTSLSMYLIPLIALMLSFDALVGEFESGTMLLLLTYPVSRWQILLGKFLGHSVILLLAILIGYGIALGILIYLNDGDSENWQAFVAMMASSLLLGCVFLSVGYMVSSMVRERSVAIGVAVFLWIMLVVLYDLGLLSALIFQEGEFISEEVFALLMLANPADAFRLFNFMGFEEVGRLVGISGIGVDYLSSRVMPLISMGIWVVAPLLVSSIRFHYQEL